MPNFIRKRKPWQKVFRFTLGYSQWRYQKSSIFKLTKDSTDNSHLYYLNLKNETSFTLLYLTHNVCNKY